MKVLVVLITKFEATKRLPLSRLLEQVSDCLAIVREPSFIRYLMVTILNLFGSNFYYSIGIIGAEHPCTKIYSKVSVKLKLAFNVSMHLSRDSHMTPAVNYGLEKRLGFIL